MGMGLYENVLASDYWFPKPAYYVITDYNLLELKEKKHSENASIQKSASQTPRSMQESLNRTQVTEDLQFYKQRMHRFDSFTQGI